MLMDILCHVCGDKASGKHYGVPSCDGCRGFFKRSIRRNLEYVCKEGGKCIIDVTRRNQCQACRFTKCIQANMKREAVQHERAPRSLITPYEDTAFRWSSAVTKIGSPYQYPSFIASQYSNPISGLPFRGGGPSVERKHFSSDNEVTSTEEVYGQSESYEEKYKRCSMGYVMHRNIHESAFRLLLLAVKWAQSIPSFSQFTEKDQSTLLMESWNDLFVLNAIQWSISLEDDILNDSICSNDDIKEFQTNLRLLVGRFSSLQTDYTEFVYLKALILFKPEAKGLHDKLHAELLQDQTQLMLHEYCFLRHHARFGKLLLLLSSVTSFDKRKIEKLLFNDQSMSELLKHMCMLHNIC